MEEKVFMRIVYAVIAIGIIGTLILTKYTIDNYNKLSITSFISTEEVLYE